MIVLDTHILARFYVDDPKDSQAAKQRPIARRIMADSTPLFVPLTVVLELEWVLRAFYGFGTEDFARVVEHLLGLAHVTVEDWPRVSDAVCGRLAARERRSCLASRRTGFCRCAAFAIQRTLRNVSQLR